MSGFTRLQKTMEDLGDEVRGRTSDLEKLTDVIASVPKLALTNLRAKGTRSSASPLIPEVLAPDSPLGSDKRTAIFDEEDELASYVQSQGDKIADILRNPSIGTFLEEYARAFQFISTHRFTGATSQRELLKLRADMQTFEKIVREWGGESGRKFDFKQFKRDLETALRQEVKTTVRAALPSSPTGKSDRCNGPSLFVLQSAGVIR